MAKAAYATLLNPIKFPVISVLSTFYVLGKPNFRNVKYSLFIHERSKK